MFNFVQQAMPSCLLRATDATGTVVAVMDVSICRQSASIDLCADEQAVQGEKGWKDLPVTGFCVHDTRIEHY